MKPAELAREMGSATYATFEDDRHNARKAFTGALAHATGAVIGAATAVHIGLGRGLREYIYSNALAVELEAGRFHARREHEVDVRYRGVDVGKQKLDLIADIGGVMVVVEVKHFEPRDSVRWELAGCQCATYLAAARLRVGLVLNFGGPVLGIRRVLNPNER